MERIKAKLPQIILTVTVCLLFLLPFLWFKPGQMDLGGDNSRLYFYDPRTYLKNYAFFSVSPSNFGTENIGFFMVPFVLLLIGLKSAIHSPTILIAGFHGLNLAVAFLSCYGIVKEIMSKDKKIGKAYTFLPPFLAGIFYILSQTAIQGWDKVLITHNQFFLNPLFFFLFLKYLKTDKVLFLLYALLISFLFSPNFSFAAAPGIFAFYPLGMVYLLFYTTRILKKKIRWMPLISSLFVCVLLQSLHIIPQVISMFSSGSVLNTTIFSNAGKLDRGLSYFSAIAPSIKVSLDILLLPQLMSTQVYQFLFIGFPFIIILGMLYNKDKKISLTAFFFLIVLFFASANITTIGLNFYKSLFNLPGFSMFRNFYGQWGYTLLFFYTILFGQAIAIILPLIKKTYALYLGTGIFVFLFITAIPFLDGSLVNPIIWQSNNIKIFTKFDSNFVNAISFLKKLPSDGKVLTLPLSDPGYQILVNDNGAYQGPSTIAYLAGKQDFAGLNEFGFLNQEIAYLVKNKKFNDLQQLLGMLNIKYIFYDSDPKVYEQGFPSFPYTNVKKFFPQNQESYKEFISKLHVTKIYSSGNKYYIYKLHSSAYHPTVYVTNNINYFDTSADNSQAFLTLQEAVGDTVANFNSFSKPNNIANSFIQIKPQGEFLQMVKNPDQPFFLQHSFAQITPSSLLYPLSLVKENWTIRKSSNAIDTYINKRLFFAAKRVDELEKFGKEIPVKESFSSFSDLKLWVEKKEDRSLLELKDWNTFNSWEFILSRYYQYMHESIEKINSISNAQWKTNQKFLINEYLLDHRKRFTNLLFGLEKPDVEKGTITRIINTMFDDLNSELNMTPLDISSLEFTIPDSSKIKNSLVLINKPPLSALQNEMFQITQGNQMLTQNDKQPENEWIAYTPVNNDSSINIERDHPKNLLDTAEFITLQNNQNITDIESVIRGGTFSWKDGLVFQIHAWIPHSYYLLSFDYNTNNKVSVVKIFDQDSKNEKSQTNLLMQNELQSGKWIHYQAVILSSNYSDTGYVQLGGVENDSPLQKLQIKNLAFFYIPNPTIFLLSQNVISTKTPQVVINKINPTKYAIKVTRASGTYTLVINESYNARWKLFLSDNENKTLQVFGLENLFNIPIADLRHSTTNGNDNTWTINPLDLQNKHEYTLIAEMTTQWYFYVGLIISIVTFVLTVLFTLFTLLKPLLWKRN